MWALRRTSSIARKSQTLSAVTFRASSAENKVSGCSYVDKTRFSEPSPHISDGSRLLRGYSFGTRSQATSKHAYSSLAGKKSSGEEDDDLEDGFSELEASSSDVTREKKVEDEHDDDDELLSEPDDDELLSNHDDDDGHDDDDDVLMEVPEKEEASDVEIESVKKTRQGRRVPSPLFKALIDSTNMPVHRAMDKWLEKAGSITRSDVSLAMLDLRRRRMFVKALQLSEWLERRKPMEFNERDYSSRVDLIAKVRGLQAAETYIEKIPESFKGEVVYRTLLANCVRAVHTSKAEQIFNKMKDLNFPITPFACNQLLLLYKRTNKKKVADVLLLMEQENVKPTLFTYMILIETKGQTNDIDGMEKIVETMRAEEIEPNTKIQALLAKYYIYSGLKEKAKVVLQEMEGDDLKKNRWACASLISLYATLGSADDVKRVWEVCKVNPQVGESLSAIEAWGKLKNIEEAEAVFEQLSKKWRRISTKHYAAMLKAYANNKMLSKGKDLVKEMAESGIQIGPLTWDALVRLYVEAGEIEKADSILRRASEQNRVKPMFNTYMLIMDQYSKRGDVHNAEKMFHRMRQDGYVSRLRQYHSLLQTYINAKAPVYGFRERMKADNIFPNKSLAEQLAQVDAFKRTAVSDLLD